MARDEQPDLILMDIQLPGMDGLAATAILKQDPATASIPVIALSALAMNADAERSMSAGCDAHIVKPLRYNELYVAMERLLLEPKVAAARPNAAGSSPNLTAPASILIVDDEIQNRRLLQALLTPDGYVTRTAASGRQALASIADDPPDLILLDDMMPGING